MPDLRFSKPLHRGTPSTARKPEDSKLSVALKLIEAERDNLSRAESLLRCLTIALEHEETSHEGPYYPDVAEIAVQMLRKSIRALDPINLPDPSRDKVKEDSFPGHPMLPLATSSVALLSRQCGPLRARLALRVHRRDYSRASRIRASSCDSAAANSPG
jgi:hypothetical protein